MIAIAVVLLIGFAVLALFGVPMRFAFQLVQLVFLIGLLYACNAVF